MDKGALALYREEDTIKASNALAFSSAFRTHTNSLRSCLLDYAIYLNSSKAFGLFPALPAVERMVANSHRAIQTVFLL